MNPTLLRTRVALDGEDRREQETLEDYFADFQEMFSIGESHYTVAAGFISKKVRKNCHPSGRCVTIYHPCLQTKELIQKTGDKIKSIPGGGALIADSSASDELRELQVLLLDVAEYFLSFAHVENEEDEGLAKAAKRFLLARRDLRSAIGRWSI